MRSLSAADLLEAWERGVDRSPVERSLALLDATASDDSSGEPARLPVGERDARLLDLHESVFGPQLEGTVACPACGESLELSLDAHDLRAPRQGEPRSSLVVEEDGYEVRFRLPTTEDLSEIADSPDAAGARRRLFERCVVDVRRGGEAVEAGGAPERVVAAVADAMENADPQAGVRVALTCPACGDRWQSPFDIAWYLWAETDAWARRTLGEVHALASVYGWSEAEILNLGARRRGIYLDLIGT